MSKNPRALTQGKGMPKISGRRVVQFSWIPHDFCRFGNAGKID